MKSTCMIGIVAAAVAWPAIASAQGGQGEWVAAARPRTTVAEGQAGGGRGGFVATVESKITTGRPYSAEAITERTQVLADGNRINVRSMTRVYRDGEGRTRRESIEPDGTVRSISISDPVGKNSYTLNPETKIAYAAGANIVAFTESPAAGGGGGTVSYERQATGGSTRVLENTVTSTRSVGGVMMRTPAPDDRNVTKEDLGQQNVEGVMATGTRTTTVIPAGEIGNAQEIRIVSEQWFSDEIQSLVMTRHNDPRSGENVYRLVNILRAEPDPALFQVPADYTVRSRQVRRPQ
jgi:hypothetical protein